jgi:hypothetical protein
MKSMQKVLIAAIALALTAGVANAAHKTHKRKLVRHHHPVIVRPVAPDPYTAYNRAGPRPPWAAPWQCFTDEGYGRYRPCDAGPSSIN